MSLALTSRDSHHATAPAGFWHRLTCLRGWLALYVVLHHVRNELWMPMREMTGHEGAWYLWNAATSIIFRYGLHAVFLFFVVSGLSIHFATLTSSSGSFSPLSFYQRRLRRLYPALLASIAFSALLWTVFMGNTLQDQWQPLFATLTFQQELLAPNFARNGPYWSLSCEGWYYLFYPLMVWCLCRRGLSAGTLLAASAALVFAAIALGVSHAIVAYAPVWIAGVWLADKWASNTKPAPLLLRIGWTVAAVSLVTALLRRKLPELDLPWFKMMYGVAMVVVVDAWLRMPVPRWLPVRLRKVSQGLGEISYSLYLNHYLIIEVFLYWFPEANQHFFQAMATSLASIALSLPLAWLSWRFVEVPFSQRRHGKAQAVERAPHSMLAAGAGE